MVLAPCLRPWHDDADGNKLAGRNPTSGTSEKNVHVHKMPWEQGAGSGKYQHLDGKDIKDAPSALNTVVVPNVNLPKVCIAAGLVDGD